MPLLGGFFSKQRTSELSSASLTSIDGDYVNVLPDKPIYNLPSSSKLKLPFRRKPPSSGDHPRISSVMSDSGHDLPPPPRKSAIFGVRNLSIHSLPNDSSTNVPPDTPARQSSSDVRSDSHPPPLPPKKSPGLFSWSRERTKSKPPLPDTLPSVPSVDDPASFNLKSFRHVRADSPTHPAERPSQPAPNSLLLPPRPRPRGDSVASDSSQRISVAAFREAQARSRANSPVPSFRPPSTADTLRIDTSGRTRASTVSVVSGTDCPQPSTLPSSPPVPTPRSDLAAPDSSSDSDSSEEDVDVDSDGEPIPKPARKRTITRRTNGNPPHSDTGHISLPNSIHQPNHPASPPTLNQSNIPLTRQRASVSTSALTPNGAARQASIVASSSSSSTSHAQSKLPLRTQKDDDQSTDSSGTDYEDAPLSDLIPPRRPGSSASNHSNSRPRIPPKPLIDINTLATSGPPFLTPILRHENSVKNLHMKGKEQDVEKDQPFSIPAVLAFSSSSSPPISPSVNMQNVSSIAKSTSTAPNRRSSADGPAPPKSKECDNNDDLINAIRLVSALDKNSSKPPSDRIVPTPIREREPPTSFTVLSRPPHRHSATDTSTSLSPTSQSHSSTSPPLSPQPESGTRQRATTMINSPTQKDKSDTISIISTSRSSASRASSRIPPVPLIHSIPDSPSLKDDRKPGRPRSASRTSTVNPLPSRSLPPPSAMPSSKTLSRGLQPSSIPHRPFASNSSIRGESPAGSSTGDSSSGRAPFTPRDGSDIGVRSKEDDAGSTVKARGHTKKHSVTFEDEPVRTRERAKTDVTNEQRTRERRRSEAKAAIELGKIVNGRGLVGNDSDEDMRLRGRNPTINVTMENGAPGMMQPSWAPWQQPMATGMGGMVPPQFSNDPAYFAAHQRALLIAKQAYQMAVAQHAMQMAGEEWERSSNIGFSSGGSVYGGGSGGSVYGGGSGGSVYGGGSGGSVYGGMGMMGMPNMGMLVPPNPWAGRSSVAFPSSAGSVYGGISSAQSEYGSMPGGWSTRSVYGDSFATPSSRPSFVSNGGPNSSSASAYGGARPRAWTGVGPPSTSSSKQSAVPGKTAAKAPPSSWKSGR